MSKQKILLFDIEIMNDMQRLFDKAWNMYPGASMGANISTICSFGYKWHGDKKAKCINVWDKAYKGKSINDDSKLVKAIKEIFLEADYVVSFYGKKFDIKHINARLVHHRNPALPDFKGKHLDLHAVAKNRLKLSHKRLDDMAEFLGCEGKLKHEGFSLWKKVYQGDKKAQAKMSAYCAQDVEVLEQVFDRMTTLMPSLPYDQELTDRGICGNCGSKGLVKHGSRVRKGGRTQRYICRDCGTCQEKKI